ncbi:hypothetical protein ALUC_60008A [Aspergillus luchuensis]|nr:hypothetical protein ALUC_60008A [Aspergillus luchuensis]
MVRKTVASSGRSWTLRRHRRDSEVARHEGGKTQPQALATTGLDEAPSSSGK